MIINNNNNSSESNALNALNNLYRNKRFGVDSDYKKNIDQLKSANKVNVN
jgi:hypothetical protein